MAFGFVGVPAVDETFDHVNHLRDVLGSPWLDSWQTNTQRRHVIVVGVAVALRNNIDRHILLSRGGVDLVINIGDVTGVDDLGVYA